MWKRAGLFETCQPPQLRPHRCIFVQLLAARLAPANVFSRVARNLLAVAQCRDVFAHLFAIHTFPSALPSPCQIFLNASRATKRRDRTVPTGISRIAASSA